MNKEQREPLDSLKESLNKLRAEKAAEAYIAASIAINKLREAFNLAIEADIPTKTLQPIYEGVVQVEELTATLGRFIRYANLTPDEHDALDRKIEKELFAKDARLTTPTPELQSLTPLGLEEYERTGKMPESYLATPNTND